MISYSIHIYLTPRAANAFYVTMGLSKRVKQDKLERVTTVKDGADAIHCHTPQVGDRQQYTRQSNHKQDNIDIPVKLKR